MKTGFIWLLGASALALSGCGVEDLGTPKGDDTSPVEGDLDNNGSSDNNDSSMDSGSTGGGDSTGGDDTGGDADANSSSSGDTGTIDPSGSCDGAKTFFESEARAHLEICLTCHVEGGVADIDDGDNFMLTKTQPEDFASLEASWLRLGDRILDMASGVESHTGGVWWTNDSSAYEEMEELFMLLEACR